MTTARRMEPGDLPANEDAEQALLGALLLDNRLIDPVGDRVRPEHFFWPVNGRIFAACLQAAAQGQSADPIVLQGMLTGDAGLTEAGGPGYLVDLVAAAAATGISTLAAPDYAEAVHQAWLRRETVLAAQRAIQRARVAEAGAAAEDVVAGLSAELERLSADGGSRDDDSLLLGDAVATVEERASAIAGGGEARRVMTGFADVDRYLGGMWPGNLLIMAARPSMGKSSALLDIAHHAARDGAVVALFSLEMSAEQLGEKAIQRLTGIDTARLRAGDLSRGEWHDVADARRELHALPIRICDRGAMTVEGIARRCRRIRQGLGRLDLVGIDYVQLMQGAVARRDGSRVNEISEITRGLKVTVAKGLDVPVLALSQLSREVEKRQDKRPQLSDLRESGSLEQDADVVMFLYREAYYLNRNEPDDRSSLEHDKWSARKADVSGLAEVICAKNRTGSAPWTVNLIFDGQRARFWNSAEGRQ